jgi:hypothetical protein
LTVRTKAKAENAIDVPSQRFELFTRGEIPQQHKRVKTPTGKDLTIGTEAHCINPTGVSLQNFETLSLLHIPQANRLVVAATG